MRKEHPPISFSTYLKSRLPVNKLKNSTRSILQPHSHQRFQSDTQTLFPRQLSTAQASHLMIDNTRHVKLILIDITLAIESVEGIRVGIASTRARKRTEIPVLLDGGEIAVVVVVCVVGCAD